MYDMSSSPAYRPGPVMGGRGGVSLPPPYRAPPISAPGLAPPPKPGPGPTGQPYSRFNISEPNVAGPGQYKSSPVPGYRHTINHENSSNVQNNLKQMLAMPKHNTLDINQQNMAIQHLRMQGMNGDGRPGDSYNGPDSLRNTANKMFSRNIGERSSGYSGQQQQYQQQQQQQQYQQQQQQLVQQQQLNQSQHSLNQSLDTSYQARLEEEAAKRNSYANQSFRAAIQQPGPKPGPGPKQPPQVPPKPGSRSASKERPRGAQMENTEENDHLETELKNILRGNHKTGSFDKINGSGTPPLPALSPGQSASQTPQSSPDFRAKYQPQQQQQQTRQQPDLLDTDNLKKVQQQVSKPGPGHGVRRAPSLTTDTNTATPGPQGGNKDSRGRPGEHRAGPGRHGLAAEHPEDIASTTTGLDLESVMALQTDLTSDEELSTTIDLSDAQAIRKQLDGLENMYTEVLKLLGLRKFGRPPAAGGGGDVKSGIARRKMYGSMSSLPSVSSIGSRHLYNKTAQEKKREERGGHRGRGLGKDKNYTKRFQRLESHVVTLARSVAHLSSEMRTQHVIVQEMEQIRQEIQQIKLNRGQHTGSLPRGGVLEPQEFFSNHPRVSQQTENRVKKLTKFFGDEPPLLRLYLKNLGYEKYASIFEEAKIGMLELPYLSEERLEKLGVPLGPRIRILQEVKMPYSLEGQNYNVYIL